MDRMNLTFTRLPLTELSNAFIAFLFAASAPVAIILSAGLKGNLAPADLASWLFAAFAINGGLTILMSIHYRQPLAFFWTIPGTVLVANALQHFSFAELIGSYLLAAALILILGVTGWVKAVMDRIPMPIVMGMVAGVFLSFGLDWIRAFPTDPWLAGTMTATFLILSAWPRVQKQFPPMIAVLIVGLLMLFAQGRAPALDLSETGAILVRPQLYRPIFSWAAAVELVIPLAVTVLAAQNAQGIAILRAAGHAPPVTALTTACGALSVLTALFGCVSTCLTGASNGLLVSSGQRSRHWLAAVLLGVMAILFGLFSPLVTTLLIATPTAFIATLAGLALLRILQGAFQSAFRQQFSLGALVAFLVTLDASPLFGIGAPFWGLVFGVGASLLLERADFRPATEAA